MVIFGFRKGIFFSVKSQSNPVINSPCNVQLSSRAAQSPNCRNSYQLVRSSGLGDQLSLEDDDEKVQPPPNESRDPTTQSPSILSQKPRIDRTPVSWYQFGFLSFTRILYCIHLNQACLAQLLNHHPRVWSAMSTPELQPKAGPKALLPLGQYVKLHY